MQNWTDKIIHWNQLPGTEVTVPAGYEELAILFKGKNPAKINIRPQPFLIPAFENEKPKLIERITKLLKNVKS